MKSHLLPFALAAAFLAARDIRGQPLPPHIAYVYPAGGRQGTTFTMWVGGQNLRNAAGAYFTGPGITAKITGFDRPLTFKEFNELRDRMQAMMKRRAEALGLRLPARARVKRKNPAGRESEGTGAEATRRAPPDAAKPAEASSGADRTTAGAPNRPAQPEARPTWTAKDQMEFVALRDRMIGHNPKPANPALAETVILEVTIAPDAEVGNRDLRLQTGSGISNAAIIQIGQLPEFTKPVATATNHAPTFDNRQVAMRPVPRSAPTEVTLPATVNGQILPGRTDLYRFAAKQGQQLTFVVSGRALIPYLADAVPGWFQAAFALLGPDGREVAFSDGFKYDPNPVVSYLVPRDGEYTMEVRDSIYRGREDFVYRINAGELPYITGIFPLGGRTGRPVKFAVSGWNLPQESMRYDPQGGGTGIFRLSARKDGHLSNAMPFEIGANPEIDEIEPNDTAANPQRIEPPVVINGRIDRPDDSDYYEFHGKAGAKLVVEVMARRLGSNLDSEIALLDATGRQLAFNDDFDDPSFGLITHQADSRIMATLPADGVYLIRITDVEHRGGPEFAYRLRVSPPQPDFDLRVTPASVNARGDSRVPLTVYAVRRDGFDGEIRLALQDAPWGFAIDGGRIPPGEDQVQITLVTPRSAQGKLIDLSLAGVAEINGHTVGHLAVPAEKMMQAFAYQHLVPVQDLAVDVTSRPSPAMRMLTRGPVQIAAGGTANMEIRTPVARRLDHIDVELNDAPEGLQAKTSSIDGDTVEVTLSCEAGKLKPGASGNLVLNAFGVRTNKKAPKGRQRTQRFLIGTLPAIPFEVVTAKSAPVAQSSL